MKNEALFLFLRELKENNNREWFHANKPRYDVLHAQFVEDVELLIQQLALFDDEIVGIDAKSCIYRIYRDIRFSHDKTPYKTFFSAFVAARAGRSGPYGGYYIHLDPDAPLLGGGVWCPPPALLKRLRRDLFDHIDEFLAIIEDKGFKRSFPSFEGEQLKRTPAGFPKEWRHEALLRYKSYTVASVKEDAFFTADNWIAQCAKELEKIYPLNRFLNETVRDFLTPSF